MRKIVAPYRNIVLVWRLLRDPRVPLFLKFIIPMAGFSVLWPLDLVKDFIPIFGRVDDLLALIIGLIVFVKLSPSRIAQEHRQNIWGTGRKEQGDVTEAEYKVLQDEEGE